MRGETKTPTLNFYMIVYSVPQATNDIIGHDETGGRVVIP
ncbi:hypothetical protein HMPREF9997_00788 [Corynebacterium durum F0235]|uniref:Uncharacterized protein n=1 Tax=Corynebacterium durum F0235 TaxID=1035195 RepID=L1MJT2_9CORY|nr:hypothetical protein HMPREF9997_00788 [Corynebacterium durum F0235]